MNEPHPAKRLRSLARPVISMLMGFGIIPLGLLALVSLTTFFEFQRQAILNTEQEISLRVASNISAYLEKTTGQIQVLAKAAGVLRPDDSALKDLIYGTLDRVAAFDGITVADLNGNELLKISRHYSFRPFELGSIAADPLFIEAKDGRPRIGNVAMSRFSRFPLVPIAVAISDIGDRVTGLIMVNINISTMWRFIARSSIGGKRDAYVVDAQGILIAFREAASVLKKRDLSSVDTVTQARHGKPAAAIYRGIDDKWVIGASAPVPLTRWAVVVETPVVTAFYHLYLLTGLFIGLFLATMAMATWLGWRFSNSKIIRPIRLLQTEAGAIARGEFDTAVAPQWPGELGQLADSLRNMALNLKKTTVSRDLLSREVEDRKRAEQALRQSENTLKSIFRVAPIGIGLVVRRHFLWVNTELCRMTGYCEDELAGRKADMLYPDDAEFERVGREKYDQIALQGTGSVETFWRRKDGVVIDVLLNSTPLLGDDLDTGVTFTALDITARKRFEEALSVSSEIVRSIPAGLFIYSYEAPERLILQEANPAAERLTGIQIDAWRDREFNDIWPNARDSGLTQALLSVMRTGKVYETDSFSYADDRLSGAYHIRAFPVAGGRLGVAFEDISEAKKAQVERERLEAELRQSHKMEAIGTLAGGIAHDFNNILSIILGNTELAMEDVPAASPARGSMDEIYSACIRAKDIVRQLLSFSRKSEEPRRAVHLIPIAAEALRLMRASLPTSIAIEQIVAPDLDDVVLADPVQIHQIIFNLSTNAAHAMAEHGGVLKIGLDAVRPADLPDSKASELTAERYLRLAVSDTGTGIPADYIERVFDPYFTTKEVGKGTGMGLAVVLGIARRHGGAVWVDSVDGRGSTFEVLLPLVGMDAVDAVPAAPILPRGAETILLVDDEKSLALILQRMLERLGYTVIAVTRSDEALALFADAPHRFDLLITDMTMPEMCGDLLAARILDIRPDTAMILCTGFSEGVDMDQARRFGFRGFLQKPIEKAKLAMAVREALDGPHGCDA
ncbi:MAG: ATP-binding protein [Pseudomonadota bacterium]